MKKKSRRAFLQLSVAGILSLIGFSWNKLTQNHLEISGRKIKIFAFHKNKPVSFYENYIVVNHKETTTVFSAHCTHLGCKINRVENEKLICPCHGSEYNLEGKVLKGPAYKNLEILRSKISDDGTQIEIH